MAVTLTGDNGGSCVVSHAEAMAGPVTFTVTNQTATAITEIELMSDNRILGEKENLAPGLPPVSFTVTLSGGTYNIYCPGAKEETVAFKVMGDVAAPSAGGLSALLIEGTKGYATYVDGVVEGMVQAVDHLKATIDSGDLAAAQKAYALARPFYERIEADVEGFVLPDFEATDNAGNLDYLIDMRQSNLDPAVGWHGLHAIERDLFEKRQINAETKALAAELQKNVALLSKLVETLEYRPEDLANGAASLLEEVQSGKITGEEEAYSHVDLVDFAANIEGAQQAFAYLTPGMQKIDPELTKQIQAQFDVVNQLLDGYRDPSQPGGYKLYTPELRAADAAKLSKAIQALQEPLSRIAEKVATAG
ncbi:iron uptake system protein EfeO [Aestuariivirga sp.]|uniref:iron uptake system protein EfeO n=1 Tax=Aestuariivirga sp. TaxID=2650926 RepID=UPI003BABFDF1